MNLIAEGMPINKQGEDIGFLIKIINNLLEKYKNMQVQALKRDISTTFILKDDTFKATIIYYMEHEILKYEISNAENWNFRKDLEKELEEVLMFT